MDRVELAACGADTAAKALVRIHEGRAATKAACRLFLHLLFGEGQSVILEGLCLVRNLSGLLAVVSAVGPAHRVKVHIVHVKGMVCQAITADDKALSLVDIAVN